MEKYSFLSAQPVWKYGCEKERNLTLVFTAEIEKSKNTTLSLACSDVYQVFVNDTFVAAGPARAAHGFFRVDDIDLSEHLISKNIVSVFVTGYNTDTFSSPNQSSFLCAEIKSGDKVIAATGVSGFFARVFSDRVKRVQRYSYQRAYSEYYRKGTTDFSLCELQITDKKQFITRGVYYPQYKRVPITKMVNQGLIHIGETVREYEDRAITEIYNKSDGFLRDELEVEATKEVGKIKFNITENHGKIYDSFCIADGEFKTFELDFNNTGFIDFNVIAGEDAKLIITFDEILEDNGDINYVRNTTANVIVYDLKKGRYHLTSAEPYTFKFIRITSIGATAQIEDFKLIEYKFPQINAQCFSDDERDIKIFNAALESFRQSTLDIYMDCPSRERAGWLCDSFFMGRVEYTLTGKSVVEKNFLENFIMYKSVKNIPDGMLPMLYPADFRTELFIPNWAMWFVIQLEDYMYRSEDEETVLSAKEKIYSLLEYFKKFENDCGLLERLENWVFIEWSKSNDYIMDVNFPTNMLYYRMKLAVSKLYGDIKILREAEVLKENIIQMSYKDGFFHDRAIRCSSELKTTNEITETAQYYAFFTGVADKEKFSLLWNELYNKFGPDRGKDVYPYISPSNAFIGYYLRLELIRQYGDKERLIEETRKYFLSMAEKTGTLWEDIDSNASLCHGFASYILLWYSNKQ